MQTQKQPQTQAHTANVELIRPSATPLPEQGSIPVSVQVPSSKSIVKLITSKVLCMIADEMNSQDVQITIKQKLIVPLINMIYRELHPYIISLIATIIVILLLSLMTFLCFLLYYFRK